MSFLDRARQAADQAREAAEKVAHDAAEKARAEAPGAAEKARGVAGQARQAFVQALDRLDPSLLADVIIKATALQERANAALRTKGSVYRIAEITVTAALPPQVGFTIQRVGDTEALPPAEELVDSTTIEAEEATDGSA